MKHKVVWKLIPASQLNVNLYDAKSDQHGYQRDPDVGMRKMVKAMAADFHPGLFGALHVAEWQGEYSVWDGHARLTFARQVGADSLSAGNYPEADEFFKGAEDPELTCMVVQDCPPDEQAWLFVHAAEDRRGIAPLHMHHANLFQRDRAALAVEVVVNKLGLAIGREINAVRPLYSIILSPDDPNGPLRVDLLHDVLWVANESWFLGRSKKEAQSAFSDRVLYALARMFVVFDEKKMPRVDIALALATVTAEDMRNRAKAKTAKQGSNNPTLLASEMLALYNSKTGRRLKKDHLASSSGAIRNAHGAV